MINTALIWLSILIAFIWAGLWFAHWVDDFERRHNAQHAGPNPEVVEALQKLGHKKQTAVRLASKVDPCLDVEIALQVIYAEYGEL